MSHGRQHSFTGVGDRCIHCGASHLTGQQSDERSCVMRELSGEEAPEPRRHISAIDDFAAIGESLKKLQEPAAAVAVPEDFSYC